MSSPGNYTPASRPVRMTGMKLLHVPRLGKRLLILDLDQTIVDINAPVKMQASRRFLHQLLARVGVDYDIAIWSATNMDVIKDKCHILDIINYNFYKIFMLIDVTAMVLGFRVNAQYNLVKGLKHIWNAFPQFNAGNTVICDDLLKNFHWNQQNGLLVEPYHYRARAKDDELLLLAIYLRRLARECDDFTAISHEHWKDLVNVPEQQYVL